MFSRIKKYIKLLAGFLTLWSFFLFFTSTHKNTGGLQDNRDQDDKKDKVASVSQQNIQSQSTDDNSFLFVDCTGFFE